MSTILTPLYATCLLNNFKTKKCKQFGFNLCPTAWKTSVAHACYQILIFFPNFLYILVIKDASFTPFWYKNTYFLYGTGESVSQFKLVPRTLQIVKCIPLHNF